MIYIVKLFSNNNYFFIPAPIPDFICWKIPKSDIDTVLGVFSNNRASGFLKKNVCQYADR